MDGNHIIPRATCVCLVLVLHVYCSRFERDTSTNDGIQPKIVSQDGHLIFMTGENHNITFRPSAGGAINIDGESLQAIVNMVKENKASLEELKSELGNRDITTRIDQLETTIESMVPTERLQEEVDTITSRLDRLYRRSVSLDNKMTGFNSTLRSRSSQITRNYNLVRSLNRRVRTVQRKVRTIERSLNRRECTSNPCQNGGTCVDQYKGFHCRCTAQWKGTMCQEDVNECYTLTGTDLGCQNGATCVNLPGTFRCDCTTNWHGILCNEAHDDCTGASHEALCGHGTCINLDRVATGQAKYKCLCADGWTHQGSDPACTVDVDECQSQPFPCSSSPRVICQNLHGTFHCGPCPPGYSGDGHTCSDINECEVNNGGCSPQVQCINTVGSRRCGNCPPGMTGDGVSCSSSGNMCGLNNGGCHPLATCTPNHGILGRSCTCPQGYIGSGVGSAGCVVGSQPSGGGCQNNPCLHGTCQPQGQGFYCVCQQGWAGTTCNANINECSSNPCKNGGTCTDGIGIYMCRCTSDFTGPTCTQAQQSCGGSLTGESGSFRFPSSSGETYPHGVQCGWTITTSPTKIVTLNFARFKLEASSTCSFDYLEVHDGPSRSSQRIGKYCGQTLPNGGSINSTTHQIHLFFNSDNSESSDGFEVHWTSALPECGGELRGQNHGDISSPGYPGNYPHNRDCVWTIRVDPGKVIKFTFAHLALETHSNCSYDYLELYDGISSTSSLLNRYCSSNDPAPIETTGPYAKVHFHSDANQNDRGFHITYAGEAEDGCGDTFTADSGILISPNYPNPYTRNAQCVWTITVHESETITFTFTNLILEGHRNCQYDYVEVRDGDDETSPFVGRYCTSMPPPLHSSGNSYWIKFKADSSNQGSGFRATWEVECGGRFSSPSGELRSPYFPESYPSNRECVYVIDQPADSTILLTFLTFDIEASDNQNCQHDSLQVRNGGSPDSPLLQTLCGTSLPAPVSSTGNQMWLKFVSDGSIQNHGFRATYSVDPEGALGGGVETGETGNTSTTIVSTCGASLTGSTGTFTSPLHPGYYPHGLNCTWYITVDPGFIIRLTFNTFSLESHDQCTYDYVAVYDNNTQSGLLGRFCGSNVPPAFTSTDNVLMIMFRSDHSIARDGFSASYVALNASSACGRELRDLTGIISSPNYPNNYPHNRQCEWTIVVSPGQQILLNITSLNMELHPNCQYDYVEIRNGGFPSSPLINRFCGRNVEEDRNIRSDTNRMFIKFKSDASGSGHGFQLQYDGTLSGCGGELTSATGSIVSPNYPNPYGHAAECFWTVTVAKGNRIHVSFIDFQTEAHSSCNYDYLMVRDDFAAGPMLGWYCGSITPDPVTSLTNRLWMKFRTDYSTSGRGFHLTYHTECNARLTTHTGVIESISFPGNYPPGQDCTYVVETTRGNTINASFSHFRLEGHDTCTYDYVELRDGEDVNGNLIGRYCSSNIPPMIATTSKFLYLHFVTDASGTNTGFRMEYVMNGCGGHFTSPSGIITSTNYPNTYPAEEECVWRVRVATGQRVQINITDFDVESHQNCRYDALEVYGGIDSSSPRLAKLCHTQNSSQILTSTGNMVYLRFRSDSSTNGRGFSLRYTSIPGGCGGVYSTPSGTISSPNYPDPYPHNTDCLWLIRVAEGRNVQLKFDAFALEIHETCNYDYVAIYDGPTVNHTRLLKACNNSHLLSQTVVSSSNIMLLRMRSDGSTALSGFQATYKTGCGGRVSAEEDGDIISPNWPGTYEKSSNCTWYIQGDHPGDRLTLTFTHMDLEEQSNCTHDFVQVLEGNDRDGVEVGKYCGTTVPSALTSQGNALVVTFVTDIYEERTGFRATYTKSTSACGARFTSEHGSFNSPGYPNSYPNDVECVWQIRTAPGNRVQLMFSMFNLEEDYLCNLDFVEVREGINGERLLNRFCGTDLPTNISSGENLFIKFRSNGANTGNGFMAHYSSVYGGALTGDSGQLASPLYPASYPPNVRYVWTVTSSVGTRIRLVFSDFQIERGDGGCRYDYVLIQDGLDDDSLVLGHFCGTDIPRPVVTSGNTMRVTFQSDYSSSGRGFMSSWTTTNESPSPAATSVSPGVNACGGSLQAMSSEQTLTSPNYPGEYYNNLNCIWTIRASPSHVVWLNITDLNTETHSQCVFDYVAVFSGADTTDLSNQVGRFCGHNIDQSPVLSSTNEMTVKFKSDGSVTFSGFSAQFKQGCGGVFEMEAGTILSPGFPQGYQTNQNCTWTIKVLAGRTVRVIMQSFNIQGSMPCTGDYLTFYNGAGMESPVLGSGRYCGSTLPTIPESSSNYMTVNFVSDGLSGTSPYMFKFSFLEKPLECGGNLYLTPSTPSGEITSPSYPSDYPPNVDCVWVITTPMNERVQIDFDGNLVIEAHHNCTYDFVELRDGGTSNSGLLGRYCGNTHPDSILSTSSVMYLRLRTDNSLHATGFKAQYKIATCGGTISGVEGFITSPGHPGNYDNNLVCEWYIRAPTGHYLTFTFEAFQLESGSDCNVVDNVQIMDNFTGSSLGQFCGSSVPTPVDTSDSLAYIRFTSNSQNAYSGFKLNFQASIEVCGGELTTPSGSLSSPNYPGLYPHTRRCTWHITVQQGRRVTLVFSDFSLELHQQCAYDYVNVYNGRLTNSPPLTDRLCGSSNPGTLESSGNTMTVVFVTDGSVSEGGFAATYTSNNPQACGGHLPYTSAGGLISSPGFTSEANYTARLQCVWVINNRVQASSSIALRFTSFSVEMHGQCFYDHVEIREGSDASGELIGRYCGNDTLPPYIASPSPNLWVQFVSDELIENAGFQLAYTFSSCGGILTSSSGVITSPNYSRDYGHSDSCAWQIEAPLGSQIKVEFTDFNIESHSQCEYDYVELFNGGLPSSPSIGRFCGTDNPATFTSQSNRLRIEFHSDASQSAPGFRLTYSFVSDGCGGLFHSQQGAVSSPNYPDQYPANIECVWDLNVQPGYHIQMTFLNPFDLQIQTVCSGDYVEISEYQKNTNSPASWVSLGRFCGNQIPSDVKSNNNRVRIKFRSDATNSGNGFALNYTAGCGAVYTADTGDILSPGYPGNYDNNLLCNYSILVDHNKFIMLTFDADLFRVEGRDHKPFLIGTSKGDNGTVTPKNNTVSAKLKTVSYEEPDIFLDYYNPFGEGPDNIFHELSELTWAYYYPNISMPTTSGFTCMYDWLNVYAGNDTQSRHLARLCGYVAPRAISSRGAMYLQFQTDNTVTDKGWRASYTAVECGGQYQGPSGQIRTPTHPLEYHHDANCSWTMTVEPDRVVQLKFTQFNIETHIRCEYDFVKVYDGADTSSPLIGQYCGDIAPPSIKSTNNSLLVVFISDGSVAKTGFVAAFWQTYGVHQGCGGLLNATSGTIQSLDFDNDGQYESNLDCVWQIQVPPNKVIKITKTSFFLEDSNCVTYDHLEIRDGLYKTDPLVGRFCGSRAISEYTSSSNALYIRFMSDDSVERSGFSYTYAALEMVCGGVVSVNSSDPQNLTSPNYPSTYPPNSNCRWILTAPTSKQVEVNIVDIDIESHSECVYDYLEIRDSPTGLYGQEHHFCGNQKSSVRSVGSMLQVNMKTDGNSEGRGFLLEYRLASCNRTYTSASGQVVSPGWPNTYPHLQNCLIVVSAPEGYKLSLFFNGFGMESHENCNYDYLQIFNGTSDNGESLSTLCGREVPLPVFLTGNSAALKFVSDSSAAFRGFDITYISSPTGCGGNLMAPNGTFTSPNYPSNSTTTTGTCYYLIQVAARRQITIHFDDLDIPDPQYCPQNYVAVYDGLNHLSPRVGKYCGSQTPADYTSGSNYVTVEYTTVSTMQGRGFKIRYGSS